MSIKSRAVINAEADANIEDNTTQNIVPVDVRQRVKDLADSNLNKADDKDASGGYTGLTLFKINFKNAANTFTSFFTNSNTAARTYTFQDSDDTIVGRATTDTLTNKRINPREVTTASAATVTTDSDVTDIQTITAQAAGLTLANPTGTPVQGQALIYRIKDNGTARAITFGANFRALGITLPTTTVISKTLYICAIYNSTDTKWDVVSVPQQA